MDGRLGEQAEENLALAQALGATLEAKVVTWDQRLTTVEAERLLIQADMSRKKRRRVVDQVATSIILQGYLDGRPGQPGSMKKLALISLCACLLAGGCGAGCTDPPQSRAERNQQVYELYRQYMTATNQKRQEAGLP